MLSFCRNGSLPLPSTKAQGRTRCPRYDWGTLACYGSCKDANKRGSSLEFVNKILLRAIAGALSVAFVSSFYSPPLAAESIGPTVELCPEEAEVAEEVSSSVVRNEDLVEEAWEIVKESFLGDAGSRSWSQEKWLQYKKYIFQNDIQTRSGAHDVIRKMLATLEDPYTRFLTPAEFSKMARYDVTGIGVNLREVPDQDGATKIKVLGVILEGPAHSAGVRQGDELLSVNGLSVKGKSAFEVSSMLQGPKETFVDIEVRHGDCGPIHSITLQRKNVARTPVFYRLENLGKESVPVGYIQIKEFNALARKDLMIALNKLHKSGATYLVLDLRNNLGGLVQAGIEVAKLFLDQGETVIYTAGRNSEVQNTFIAEAAPFSTNTVIVLVNNRTASASEIVASALHDNCKAVLVGEKTYGKGLIQSVYELRDGSGVVVTIGKYITPGHMDINGNGLEPDFSNFPDLHHHHVVYLPLTQASTAALDEVRRQLTRCQLLRSGLDLKTVMH